MELDDILEFQNLQLENYGWYIHYVPGDPDLAGMTNIHTHGIQEKFDHPDFQIVLPLNPAIAQRIFENCVDLVKAGTRFKHGEQYSEILQGYKVLAMSCREYGRDIGRNVVRIIIPDKYGCLNEFTIQKEYRRQWPGKEGGTNGNGNGRN